MRQASLSSVLGFFCTLAACSADGPVAEEPDRAHDALSADFSVVVGGTTLPVTATDIADHASFEFTGSTHVTITAHRDVTSAIVRPLSLGIEPKVRGRTIEFDVSKAAFMTVEINGDITNGAPLYLFADPPESERPAPGTPKVRYYAGDKSQVYDVGTLSLGDGETLYVERGATLLGKISVKNASNVKVLGNGTIDARKVGGRVVRIEKSDHVTLDGPTFVNTGAWAVVPAQSQYVTLKNVKIVSWGQYSDGIDIVGSQHVTVDHAFVRSEDDTITIKNNKYDWWGNVEDVTVTDTVLFNGPAGNGLEIGYELAADYVRDVTFRNIDIVHKTARDDPYNRGAISIHHGDDATVSNIRYEDIRIEDAAENYFNLQILKSGFSTTSERGHVRDITFDRVRVIGGKKLPSALRGFDASHRIENVTFAGLSILGTTVTSANASSFGFSQSHTKGILFTK